MKYSRLLGAACAFISVFTAPQAMSVTIDTYFGWNYVSSVAPATLSWLPLESITYTGASGTVTQNIDWGGAGIAMPDGAGLATKPTPTYDAINDTGDGQSTRTQGTSMSIDWFAPGATTPWGVQSFPTIGITGIKSAGVVGDLYNQTEYVVGLIPAGANTELDSALSGYQRDIYTGAQGLFAADPQVVNAYGYFIFSAAEVVPLPPAFWLFGSGLLGLIGIARHKKAA